MLTQEEINTIQKFVKDPDWKIMEKIIINALDSVSYEIPDSTAPTEFKARMLANKKIKDTIEKILNDFDLVHIETTKEQLPWR